MLRDMKTVIMLISSIIVLLPVSAFADEQFFITQSSQMDDIIFDGKWTFETEWKESSLKEIHSSDGITYLRVAHQDNFVYVFLDVLHDKKVERIVDKAIVCFDTKNNKSEIPDADDYCFVGVNGKQTGITLQGGSNIPTNNYFKNIKNHPDMIALGGISDENDRYSDIPHASYEFKIPTEVIGRSDNYGFYVRVFDSDSSLVYSWPDISLEKSEKVPSPTKWGDLISPDKSLPEIPMPLLILMISMVFVIVILRKGNFLRILAI